MGFVWKGIFLSEILDLLGFVGFYIDIIGRRVELKQSLVLTKCQH